MNGKISALYKVGVYCVMTLVATIIIGLITLIPTPAHASWEHHVDNLNFYGVGNGGSANYSGGVAADHWITYGSGNVFLYGRQFDFSSAECADVASGHPSLCGCGWPKGTAYGLPCSSNTRNWGGWALVYAYEGEGRPRGLSNDSYWPLQDVLAHIDNYWNYYDVTNYVDILVYGELGDDPTYDITWETPYNLYNYYQNSKTLTYQRTTPLGAKSDNKLVKGTVWRVYKQEHWAVNIQGGTSHDPNADTYWAQEINRFSQNIVYTSNPVNLTDEVYTPLNINRGGYWDSKVTGDDRYITSSDEREWSINFNNTTNVGKIDGYATNSQDITDNSLIEGLDTNTDIPFKLEFNNACLGLDASKNWANKPPLDPSAQTTDEWKYMNAGESYAKGYNGNIPAGDDRYRYSTQLNGAVQDLGDQHLTSLYSYDDKEEFVTGTDYIYELPDNYSSNYNNIFGVRAISGGSFKTANNYSKKYPYCWVASWAQGRFYEYGIHYEGTITINGISAPGAGGGYKGIITGQQAQSGNAFSLYTDSMTHRGLYLDYDASNGETPVVVGKWIVKTLAGSATR